MSLPLYDPFPELSMTPREFEVATLLAEGYPPKAICEKLFISSGTLAAHCGRLVLKFHLSDYWHLRSWTARNFKGEDRKNG